MEQLAPETTERRRAETTAPSDDPTAGPADDALLRHVRAGDLAAYGELWRRHHALALAVARSTTSRFDPEDVAAESFARVLAAIVDGKGPVRAFRAYLVTAVRNTAATWGRSGRCREYPVADPYDLVDAAEAAYLPPPFVEASESPVMVALASLPERVRSVLWYGVVEGYSRAELAASLGITTNAAGVLAFRAREALRQAWIQAHLDATAAHVECSFALRHLAAYTRGALPSKRRARVHSHLSICSPCAGLERHAHDLSLRFEPHSAAPADERTRR